MKRQTPVDLHGLVAARHSMANKIVGTFTINLKGQPGAYTVEATGPQGVAVAPQPFNWSPSPQHADSLRQLGEESADVEPEPILQLGRALYDAVFIPQIATALGRAQARLDADEGLRLKIQANYPNWQRGPGRPCTTGWILLPPKVQPPSFAVCQSGISARQSND